MDTTKTATVSELAATVYEPPALVEVGGFSELTLGWIEGNVLEAGGEGQLWSWV